MGEAGPFRQSGGDGTRRRLCPKPFGQLLALKTSGFVDTSLIGPQANLATAPVWDRYVTGYISSLMPNPIVPPTESYLGSVYQMTSYGDLLRLFIEPDGVTPFALQVFWTRRTG